MIIGGIYHGRFPVARVYRGTNLIWWAAEEREYEGFGQQIHTVITASADQAELEALAMGCGMSVRTSASMAQHTMLMIGGTGILLVLEVAAHQSPSAAVAPDMGAWVSADVTARAGVSRAAESAMTADAVADVTMHAPRVRPHWGGLAAQARPDTELRASGSRPQGMDSRTDAALHADMRTSPVAPAAGQMDVWAGHKTDMAASQVRRAAAESSARVRCTAAFHNSTIELITVGGSAVEVIPEAELRAAESLAVALLSGAEAAISGTLVQSPTVNTSTDFRVTLTPSAEVRQGLTSPQAANARVNAELAAEGRMALPRNSAGRMTPAVTAAAGLTPGESIGAATRQTVTAATEAAMADDAAKAPVTGTGAKARQTVALSSWAGPIQRGSNLLIRQAIHVTQEGKTLYIK